MQSIDQSVNESVSQSVNQSMNQSVNQSINQSIKQLINLPCPDNLQGFNRQRSHRRICPDRSSFLDAKSSPRKITVCNAMYCKQHCMRRFKQRGKSAEEACNVFYYLTYEGAVDLDQIEDPTQLKVRPVSIQVLAWECSSRLVVRHACC